MSSSEYKKDTIVIDHTKSPTFQRQQQQQHHHQDVPEPAKPTDQAGRLGRATEAADQARIEAAERLSRRAEVRRQEEKFDGSRGECCS